MSEVEIRLIAVDNASKVFSDVAGNVETASGEMTSSTDRVTGAMASSGASVKESALAFNNMATGCMALYGAVDQVEKSQVALDQANLKVLRSSEAVEKAQKDYNSTVEKYGSDSAEAKDAADKLAITTEAHSIALDKANIAQGNVNETMARAAMSVIPSIITVVSSASTAFSGMSGAMEAIGGAMDFLSTNPIILIIAGIAALVAGLIYAYDHCAPFREAVDKIASTLSAVFGPVIEAVSNALTTLWNSVLKPLGEFIAGAFTLYIQGWILIFQGVQTVVETVCGAVGKAWEGLKSGWETVSNAFKTSISGFSDHCTTTFNSIHDKVTGTWNKLTDALQSVWSTTHTTLSGAISKFEENANKTFSDLHDGVIGIWNKMTDALQSVWTSTKAILETAITAFKTAANTTFEELHQAVKATWDTMCNVLESLWKDASDFLNGAIQLFKDSIYGIFDLLGKDVKTIWDGMCSVLETAWKTASELIQGAVKLFKDLFTGNFSALNDDITGIWNTLWDGVKEIFKTVSEAVKTLAGTFIDAVEHMFGDMAGFVIKIVFDCMDRLYKTVTDTLGGILKGITGFISNVCFAHALAKAAAESTVTMTAWANMMEETIGRGLMAIGVFKEGAIILTGSLGGYGSVGAYTPSPIAVGMARSAAPIINITGPLVYIEGLADRQTAERAAQLVRDQLKSVIVEPTSTSAYSTHKRIRVT